MEWPQPFGRTMSAAEETIHAADEKTGLRLLPSQPSVQNCSMSAAPWSAQPPYHQAAAAGASLKLTILNPKGRVWTMVAGGGASVIYTDTVGDLGYAQVTYVCVVSVAHSSAIWHSFFAHHTLRADQAQVSILQLVTGTGQLC
jgi:succinyl-CoA synthetase beta subunit